jgi:hypothetical protein
VQRVRSDIGTDIQYKVSWLNQSTIRLDRFSFEHTQKEDDEIDRFVEIKIPTQTITSDTDMITEADSLPGRCNDPVSDFRKRNFTFGTEIHFESPIQGGGEIRN